MALRTRAALSALVLVGGLACKGEPPRPNLLLVSLDTTRPDRLGCYGYEKDTSPHLDRLCAESVVYTRAYSTSSWTLPAHASLFTGEFPSSHGARLADDGPLVLSDAIDGDAELDAYRARGLSPSRATLAEILAREGFATAAVVAGPWMKRVFGLDHGFQHYDDDGITSAKGRLARSVSAAALQWLDAAAPQRFFLFLNYYDPHSPYRDPLGYFLNFLPDERPPGEVPLAARRSARYDGEIRYMDEQLGRLFEGLRRRGLFDELWVIVTADHGELLGEHDRLGHGRTLFEEEIRIPLIVRQPASARRVGTDDTPIQLTDLFALILEGYELPNAPAARSDDERVVFAEVERPDELGGEGEWRTLMEGPFKFHWSGRDAHRLFDLSRDPGEQSDLAPQAEALRKWEDRVERFVAALPPPGAPAPPREVDPETQRALKELGYLD